MDAKKDLKENELKHVNKIAYKNPETAYIPEKCN
jgi:hypothetical protein